MEKSSHLPKVSKRGRQGNGRVCCLERVHVAPSSWGCERLVSCCGRERRADIPLSPPSHVLEEGLAGCSMFPLRLVQTPL